MRQAALITPMTGATPHGPAPRGPAIHEPRATCRAAVPRVSVVTTGSFKAAGTSSSTCSSRPRYTACCLADPVRGGEQFSGDRSIQHTPQAPQTSGHLILPGTRPGPQPPSVSAAFTQTGEATPCHPVSLGSLPSGPGQSFGPTQNCSTCTSATPCLLPALLLT